ncbi:MAG: hypothetical protein HS126_04655 [Anaerolineales bacterium]|nr:hypothetical protein [Anaerolineales bacterium]
MAKRKSRLPKQSRSINLIVQNIHVQHRFSGFSCHISRGCAVWRGFLQPQSISPVYQIEIEYKLKQIPKVKVISPPLAPNAKHLYPDGSLCLYWPKEWWWRQDNLIAEIIIPWAASWLYHYELWLDTGKWLGPSSHDSQR